MRPVDFVVYDGHTPADADFSSLSKALISPLVISGENGVVYEVLGYYYDEGKMRLDIFPRTSHNHEKRVKEK